MSQPTSTEESTPLEADKRKAAEPTVQTDIIPALVVRRRLWTHFHLGALLAHLGLSVLFTWPLVLNFLPGSGTTVPGFMREDRDQNLWNLWWTRDALLSWHNPFVTNMIWYPTPVSLYYHTLNFFNGLLATPLMFIFSLTTTYNIIVLFSFVMGGYGAFLLVHYICGNRWAGLVGSVVFAYSAYHIGAMRSLLQLVSLEWVPFFVLFLLMAVFGPEWGSRRDVARWSWQRALPAGFFLFLVSLVDWYYTMYSLMLAGLVGVYVLVRYVWERAHGQPSTFRRAVAEPWVRIAGCIAIYFMLISPILIPTIKELRTTSYMLPAPNAALSHSADLLTFFEPMRGQQLWGRFFLDRDNWPFGADRYEDYFTYTALFLGAVALFATRALRPRLSSGDSEYRVPSTEYRVPEALQPRLPTDSSEGISEVASKDRLPGKWFWGACVLLFFLLALGPVLQIGGNQIKWLLMPYELVEGLPILNISRSPDRFDMPLTLCLAVLTGFGTNVLIGLWLPRLALPRRGALLSLGAVALIALELFPFPYPQNKADIPRWYYQLAKEQGDFSILELPPQDDYWHGAYRMYFQTTHGKRIFGGYISREYPHPFLQSTPGYQELTYVDGSGDMFASGPDQWYSAFQMYSTRYIVLYKNRAPHRYDPPVDVSPSREAIHNVLGQDARPFYQDEQLEVYRVPLPAKQAPFLSVGDGWQPREVGPNGSFRWMGARATLRIDAPRAEDAYLTFKAAGLGPPRRLQILHGDQLIFDETVSALQTYRTKGPLGLPQGVSTLTFNSPDGTVSPSALGLGDDPRSLSFAILDAKLEAVEK